MAMLVIPRGLCLEDVISRHGENKKDDELQQIHNRHCVIV